MREGRSEGRSKGRAVAIVDAALVACLVVVPLLFSTGLRSFTAPKLAALELLVGLAALATAAAPTRPRGVGPRVAAAACVYVLLTLSINPSADGLAAALLRIAWFLLVTALWWRLPSWRPRQLALALGLPLLVDLLYSLTQAAGVGVLASTRASFGARHGLLVGTVGNPSENGWYLALGVTLLADWIASDRRLDARRWWPWWALTAAGALAVVLLNDARAALLAGGLAGACWLLRSGPRRRARALVGLLLVGLAVAIGVARGGLTALAGRGFLARVSGAMFTGARGLPRGPGGFARDFPEGQATVLAEHPELARWYSLIDHAHCDPLELLIDYGAPALLVLAALIVALARARDGRARARAPTLVAGAAIALLGYPLHEPVSSVLLAVALAGALPPPAPAASRSRSWARAAGSLAWALAGVALIVGAGFQLASERAMTASLAALERGEPARGQVSIERAVARWPSADALFFYGNFELLAGRPGEARAALTRSFAQRPRPETAMNLALALDALAEPASAAEWRARARRLRGAE